MDYGVWTENSRNVYNKWDGVARSTTQVISTFTMLLFLEFFKVFNISFTGFPRSMDSYSGLS